MKNRKRKTILLVIIIILIGIMFLVYPKNKEIYKDNKENKITFAIMVEKNDGKYVEYRSKEWPKVGYRFSKSECIDRDNNNLGELIEYNAREGIAVMKSKKSTFCTLYFDKDNTAPVVSEGSFYIGSTPTQEYTNKINEEIHIKIEDEDAIEYCLINEANSALCNNDNNWKEIPELDSEGWITTTGYNLGETNELKTVYLYLKDGARNISEVKEDSIVLDTTPPSCQIGGNPTNWQNTDATLTQGGTDTGVGTIYYSWDNKNNYSTTKVNKTVSSNGTYTLYVKDSLGNETSCNVEVTKIDKTPPSCSIGGNTSSWSKSKTLTQGGTDTGVGTIYYSWDNKNNYSTTKVNKTVNSNGTYTLYVKDSLGNEDSCSVTVSKIDKIPPSCSISGNPSSWTNENQTLTGSGTDTGEGKVYYKWDTGSYGSTANTNKTKTISANGTYTLYVKDSLGNEDSCSVNVTKIDKNPPRVDFSLDGQTAKYTCSNGGSGSPLTGTTSGSKALSGTSNYTYSATCKDTAGNSKTDSHIYIYDNCLTTEKKCYPGYKNSCKSWNYSGRCLDGSNTFSGDCGCGSTFDSCSSRAESAGSLKCYSGYTYVIGQETKYSNYSSCAYTRDECVGGFRFDDPAKPSCTISVNTNNWAKSKTLIPSGTDPNNKTLSYSWDNKESYSTTKTNKTINENGTYYLWVKNSDGKEALCTIDESRIDNIAPTCSISGNTSTVTTSKTLVPSGSDSEQGTVSYSWDDKNHYSTTITNKIVTENKTYTLWVKDGVGNETSCSTTITTIKTTYTCIKDYDACDSYGIYGVGIYNRHNEGEQIRTDLIGKCICEVTTGSNERLFYDPTLCYGSGWVKKNGHCEKEVDNSSECPSPPWCDENTKR